MLDGVEVTAAGTGTMWGALAITGAAAPYAIPAVMAAGFIAGLAGTEKIEEGTLQMKEAVAKHEQREEQLRYAEEAQAQELKELEEAKEKQEAEDREDNRLLEQSEQMLREDSTPAVQGGAGAPPANAETYSGELPSFPAQVINAPPPHQPEIILQPLDTGAGYNNTPGRLY